MDSSTVPPSVVPRNGSGPDLFPPLPGEGKPLPIGAGPVGGAW
jgi:hypothetical protein